MPQKPPGKYISKSKCPHIAELKITHSDKKECVICREKEHLRLCTSCGAVHCCESHRGHNTEHYKKTGHPIIQAIHTPYNFTWCYVCEAYLE